MRTRILFVQLLSLLVLALPGISQSAVTVYCCDAAAEAEFTQDMASLTSLNIDLTSESFEGTDWQGTRTLPESTVTSQGITWAPSSTGVASLSTSTGGGDVHDGSYTMFPVDDRNNHLVPDQYTLSTSSITLYGVGGWFRSATSTKLAFTTNSSGVIDFSGAQSTVFDWTFLGFIDDAGFSNLQIATSDETGNEANTFFSDDFTLGAESGAFPGQKLQFSSASYTVSESSTSIHVTLERSGGTSGALSIDYATGSEGTATAGQDFTATSGTLDFADGESSKQFTIDLIDDGIYEGDETVSLILTGSSVGVQNSATLTISENDPQPVGAVQFSGSSYKIIEGTASLTITVQRDDGDVGSGSVDYTTSNSSAIAGNDYTSSSGTLNFIDGQVSSSFTIDITDDATQEGVETFLVTLTNPLFVTLGSRNFAEVVIQDNEPAASGGTVQFSGATYQVSEGAAQISLPVTRINGSTGAISVVCSSTDSSATTGSDYTTTQSTLNFANGEIIQHCIIPVVNDSSYENDETLIVTLGSLSGDAVEGTPGMASVTIKDDDPVPAMGSLQFALSEFTQTESGATAAISITRTGGTSGAVTVSYATSDDSALAGDDYTSASGILMLANGVSSASFQITLLDDNFYEGDEQLNIKLSNPTGGAVLGSNSSVALTIGDDEQAPVSGMLAFSMSEYSADEFDGSVTVTVQRVNGTSGVALVNYATSDGTATATSDYSVANGTLTFADGEISQSFSVTLNDDSVYEGIEELNLTLSNPFGAILGDQATATISLGDDDSAPAAGALSFSQGSYDVTENESSVTVNVSRVDGSTGAVSVDYATLDSSATASADYSFNAGRITFADGESASKSFSVTINDDSELEGEELIALQLANAQGGAVLGAESNAIITVADDEALTNISVLTFSASTLSVDESSGSASITITRSTSVIGSMSVDLMVESASAVAGTDYNVTTGTLQFADGETEKSVMVEIINNTDEDGDRTVTFALGNVTGNATIDSANNSLLITILDDDAAAPVDSSSSSGGGGGSVDLMLLISLMSAAILLYRPKLNAAERVVIRRKVNATEWRIM